MTTNPFESELRAGLADAAQDAPPFNWDAAVALATTRATSATAPDRGLQPDHRRQPARRGRWLAVAAAGALVTAAGVGLAIASRQDGTQTASCSAEVVFGGSSYAPMGDLRVVPLPGPSVGTASRPACDDGNGATAATDVDASRLTGVDPATAFLGDGTVWVRVGAQAPDALRALLAEPACTTAGTVTGRLEGVESGSGSGLTPPLMATVRVTSGPGALTAGYAAVVLDVRLTSDTRGVQDHAMLRTALDRGTPVELDLTCQGAAFVAGAVRAAG